MIYNITGKDNKTLKMVRTLKKKSVRHDTGRFIAEGVRLVEEALLYASEEIYFIVIEKDFPGKHPELMKLAEEHMAETLGQALHPQRSGSEDLRERTVPGTERWQGQSRLDPRPCEAESPACLAPGLPHHLATGPLGSLFPETEPTAAVATSGPCELEETAESLPAI